MRQSRAGRKGATSAAGVASHPPPPCSSPKTVASSTPGPPERVGVATGLSAAACGVRSAIRLTSGALSKQRDFSWRRRVNRSAGGGTSGYGW